VSSGGAAMLGVVQLVRLAVLVRASVVCPEDYALEEAWTDAGLCTRVFASGLRQPRGAVVTPMGDVLVVERQDGVHEVTLLYSTDADVVADGKLTVAQAPGLNHGIALRDGYLYASSDSTVYRWSFVEANVTREQPRKVTTGPREVVVFNVNADGQGGAPEGHRTRTLEIGPNNWLYVSVGSLGNVDPSPYRSRIRRFNISMIPPDGFDFQYGEVFADGVRNEVGLALDSAGVLWGVDNGPDYARRSDLAGEDMYHDNPGEELNRFPEAQAGGYPPPKRKRTKTTKK